MDKVNYKHDRELIVGAVDNVAIGVWQKYTPLLFDYLYESQERKEELARFIRQMLKNLE